jgi:hypothetical protein
LKKKRLKQFISLGKTADNSKGNCFFWLGWSVWASNVYARFTLVPRCLLKSDSRQPSFNFKGGRLGIKRIM